MSGEDNRGDFEIYHRVKIPVWETPADDTNPDIFLARALDKTGRKLWVHDPRVHNPTHDQKGPATIFASKVFYGQIYLAYMDSPAMQELKTTLMYLQNHGFAPELELLQHGISEVVRQRILLPRNQGNIG